MIRSAGWCAELCRGGTGFTITSRVRTISWQYRAKLTSTRARASPGGRRVRLHTKARISADRSPSRTPSAHVPHGGGRGWERRRRWGEGILLVKKKTQRPKIPSRSDLLARVQDCVYSTVDPHSPTIDSILR